MRKILSVIPNICEGCDKEFVELLSEKLKAVPQLAILDVSMDKTRNRTVYALAGVKEAIFEAGRIMYSAALKNIDMRKHKGEYPRIGALDVFPFVPLIGVAIEEAVEISREFAEMVAGEFKIPVYLFSESSRFPMRKDIQSIREGEYENLEERMKDPRWKPDYGPDSFNPDFGATIVGARFPLVSFKVDLDTSDLAVAADICKKIQYSTGKGLRNVTAYSGIVHESSLAEITVSISNYTATPIYRVLEMIRMEGRKFNTNIKKVEMIGLIPEKALLDSAQYYMNIHAFSYERLLEKSIQAHLNENLTFLV
jgi:glutamate formiminotransferase